MTDAIDGGTPRRGSDWLSLGPASRQLGVDPDTLRRWADGGRIRAYATPGGHRRFLRADLDRVQESRRSRRRKLSTLGATPDRLTRAYARSYRVDRGTGVAGRFEGEDREALRQAGRQLVGQMLAFLDASSASRKSSLEAEARAAVEATARRLAASGTTIAAAVEAFTAARRPFLAELEAVGRRRAMTSGQGTALYADAASLFDRLLVHFVGAFQEASLEA